MATISSSSVASLLLLLSIIVAVLSASLVHAAGAGTDTDTQTLTMTYSESDGRNGGTLTEGRMGGIPPPLLEFPRVVTRAGMPHPRSLLSGPDRIAGTGARARR